MPSTAPMPSTTQNPPAGKRKFVGDANDENRKKQRRAALEGPAGNQPSASATQNEANTSPYAQVYNPILTKLVGKYDVKPMSVMSSTSISHHVDRALQHLGKFSMWDKSVLPGVVLLVARAGTTGKAITIAEVIRRRIGESEQKWFQYNVLGETASVVGVSTQGAGIGGEVSVVEDTNMGEAQREDGDGGEEEEFFETMQPLMPAIHQQAVHPAKIRHKAHMVIILSRVPINELNAEPNISLQTNQDQIEYLRKKKLGLVA